MSHLIGRDVYARLIDKNGNAIVSEVDMTGKYHLGVSVNQDVYVDPNNTVAAGTDTLKAANSYTYTGTSTTTLGVNALQVNLFTDVNCRVYLDQSPNGTNWDIIDVFAYVANSTNFGVTVQATSAYYRVRVTSLATTTVFRLTTAMCPIVETLPRTLDYQGNFRISAPVDIDGNKVRCTPNDELMVAERTRMVGSQFEGATLDSNFWATSVSTGTVTVSGGVATVTSGTAAGHYARLYSVRRGQHVSGATNKFRTHLRLADAGTANVKRRWGIGWGDAVNGPLPVITDGAYFELDGTTFSVVTMKGTTESRVSSGAFNGVQGYSYTPNTNNTVYEIMPQNGSISFYAGDVLLHKVTAATAMWSNTMHFHCYFDVVNSGNSSAVGFEMRTANISRLGKVATLPIYKNITGNAATWTLKIGPGQLHKVVFNNTSGTDITIYDNTTAAAPTIGKITTATAALGTWEYNLPFFNGLTLVTTGNSLDATIVYE